MITNLRNEYRCATTECRNKIRKCAQELCQDVNLLRMSGVPLKKRDLENMRQVLLDVVESTLNKEIR